METLASGFGSELLLDPDEVIRETMIEAANAMGCLGWGMRLEPEA